MPEAEPAGIVPTAIHVVAPAARRCSVTIRPDTRLPPRRPYESESTTLSVATNVVELPTTIWVGEAVIVRTVDMSRHVEYFEAVVSMSYMIWSRATSHRPKTCRLYPEDGLVREYVWTTASR